MKLIYVHLGGKLPEHLLLNAKRHQQMFPEIEVIVIVDSFENVKYLKYNQIASFFFESDTTTKRLIENSKLDYNFRDGFWIYSLIRLFALAEYQIIENQPNILHIESDVLLLPNFPWKIFSTLKSIYWTRFNQDKDVAALVFIPSSDRAVKFKDSMMKALQQNPDLTDMSLLSKLSTDNPEYFRILPSLDTPMGHLQNKLSPITPEAQRIIGEEMSLFGGVFDPAAIGMWLTGQDPRNYFGTTKVHGRNIIDSGDSFTDPSNISYSLNESKELLGGVDGDMFKIFNLHVHSKRLSLFGLNWNIHLARYIKKSANPKEFNEKNLKLFITLLLDNFHNKTLIRYLSNLPYIRTVKKALLFRDV